MSNDIKLPIGDGKNNRDSRDLDLLGLKNHTPLSHKRDIPDEDLYIPPSSNSPTNVSPQPLKKGMSWLEFFLYVVLLVVFWVVGQTSVGIPDELGADILLFIFALLRQKFLLGK